MKRNLCIGLIWLICMNTDLLMAIDFHYSPSIIGQRSVDELFTRAKENLGEKDRNSTGRKLSQNSTLGPRPQLKRNNGILQPNAHDDRRQSIMSEPNPFMTTEDSMFPDMLWNPWAFWGMRYANAMQRSAVPWWNMWYRMHPMVFAWNRLGRYREPAPTKYGQYYGENERYRPGPYNGNFLPYPGDSEERYPEHSYNQQPSKSSYYNINNDNNKQQITRPGVQQNVVTSPSDDLRTKPISSQPSVTNAAQPSYSDQRMESDAQPSSASQNNLKQSRTEPNVQILPSSRKNIEWTRAEPQDGQLVAESQNYLEQASTQSDVQPLSSSVSASQRPVAYRRQPVKPNVRERTGKPITLLYYEDSLENSNTQAQQTSVPTTPKTRPQRIVLDSEPQRI